MHVNNLQGSSINAGSTWTAVVTITVHDDNENPVSNATVGGSWSNGATGSASCTTNSEGKCSISKSGIRKRVGSVTFTVDNVTHDTLTYDATQNDVTSITVNKP